MTTVEAKADLAKLTTEIVSSYVSFNPVPAEDLSKVIGTVAGALAELEKQPQSEPQKPAVPIKKSVRPDYIICLEDGAKLKMLKRYLRTHYDMTPEQYREKWNLPADYPMVAPNYSEKRSQHAKRIGLGTKTAKAAAAEKTAKARGGRKRSGSRQMQRAA